MILASQLQGRVERAAADEAHSVEHVQALASTRAVSAAVVQQQAQEDASVAAGTDWREA
jgi:hypothetical protein